ncbi:paired amphipathic helix protein Sin3-like 4-like, partial [Trifolium medium]|nr:paired amphipathic helix protein Sin3-like 4-like [Trifolium medium]
DDDANAFVKKVKDVFEDKNNGKCDELDGSARRIDLTVGGMVRVRELFKGHAELVAYSPS